MWENEGEQTNSVKSERARLQRSKERGQSDTGTAVAGPARSQGRARAQPTAPHVRGAAAPPLTSRAQPGPAGPVVVIVGPASTLAPESFRAAACTLKAPGPFGRLRRVDAATGSGC